MYTFCACRHYCVVLQIKLDVFDYVLCFNYLYLEPNVLVTLTCIPMFLDSAVDRSYHDHRGWTVILQHVSVCLYVAILGEILILGA
jgi:hypothetical protein